MLHQTPPQTGLIKVRQELSITHRHYPLESALFMRKNQRMRPFLQKALLLRDLCNNGRCQTWHARRIVSQPFEMGEIEAIQRTATHRKRWQPHETQVLIAAKKEIESAIVENGSKRKRKRWEDIEIFCQTKGVDRTAQQCKERWDRLMVLYSQIRSWENACSAERSSFWSMDLDKRKSNGFLMGIDQESYAALDELCNKEGITEIIAETSFGSNVERKVEDGDNTNGLQAEDNVLAEAKSHNVHDEGHLVEKSGFKPAIKAITNAGMFEANAMEVQATTDSIKEVFQKIESEANSSSIAVNPLKGSSNATAYIDVDKIDEDNALTRMTLNQMEEHIKAVVLHTTEKHIKAGDTINPQRNDHSVEEDANPTLKGLISHFPQSEFSSGELASTSPVAQPSKGLDLAEDVETENINKIQTPGDEDSNDSSFLCKENNAMSRQLPDAISLQGNFLHCAQGEYLSGNHTIISSLDTHAKPPSKEVSIEEVIPIEDNCKGVSLSEEDIHTKGDDKSKRPCDNGPVEDNCKAGSLAEEEDIHLNGDDNSKRTCDNGKAYDSRQSHMQFEAKETSMSSNPELVLKENSCVKTGWQKIALENEVKNGISPSKNEMQEVDASFHCQVTENVCGNMSDNRIDEVSYELKVPEKLSMEGNLGGSSMEMGSDTSAKSIKGFETSKVGNEEMKQKNTTTTTKYSELDDDIFVYIQSAFANLVKFVSQTITKIFKG